jgi:hypothetical protein
MGNLFAKMGPNHRFGEWLQSEAIGSVYRIVIGEVYRRTIRFVFRLSIRDVDCDSVFSAATFSNESPWNPKARDLRRNGAQVRHGRIPYDGSSGKVTIHGFMAPASFSASPHSTYAEGLVRAWWSLVIVRRLPVWMTIATKRVLITGGLRFNRQQSRNPARGAGSNCHHP